MERVYAHKGWTLSLPSRERGLKYKTKLGFWDLESVAPFAGAWIEIELYIRNCGTTESLPSRERGLKFKYKPRK